MVGRLGLSTENVYKFVYQLTTEFDPKHDPNMTQNMTQNRFLVPTSAKNGLSEKINSGKCVEFNST